MIRGNSHHRRPDPFLLLIAAVILGVVMTSAATAGEYFNFLPKPQSAYGLQSQDDGVIVASMGHSGGAVNVSLTPPQELPQDFLEAQGATRPREMFSHVFVFVRYPW
jgi:hypothetical protein